MNMLEKHFPEDHKFRKLFNKHTVKLSYSCMPSMSSVIHKHNKSIMNAEKETESRKCNCPRNSTCPLDGNCLQKNLIYKAAVSSGEDTKFRVQIKAGQPQESIQEQGLHERYRTVEVCVGSERP